MSPNRSHAKTRRRKDAKRFLLFSLLCVFAWVCAKAYCGIDLHTKKMYVCVLNDIGEIVAHKNLDTDPGAFLKLIAPYREDIVVAAECMFTWYWVADLCASERIPFVLGHALYMFGAGLLSLAPI